MEHLSTEELLKLKQQYEQEVEILDSQQMAIKIAMNSVN
jgi:prefoldin subunit 5